MVTPLTRSPGNRVLTLGGELMPLGSSASGLQLFFWERCRDLSEAQHHDKPECQSQTPLRRHDALRLIFGLSIPNIHDDLRIYFAPNHLAQFTATAAVAVLSAPPERGLSNCSRLLGAFLHHRHDIPQSSPAPSTSHRSASIAVPTTLSAPVWADCGCPSPSWRRPTMTSSPRLGRARTRPTP